MPVFLLPLLIQSLCPNRHGFPTIESHTHRHGGVGCSRWSSWFTRLDHPSPLQVAPVALGEHDSSTCTLQNGAPPSGFGLAGIPGKYAHYSSGNLEFQREYHTECTTNSEPFNGGTASQVLRQSLNLVLTACGIGSQRQNPADTPHTGVFTEKETA